MAAQGNRCCDPEDSLEPADNAWCDDWFVQDCVCRLQPECCSRGWGPQCVLEAALSCGTCPDVDPAIIDQFLSSEDLFDAVGDGPEEGFDVFFGKCPATPSAAFPGDAYDCNGPDEDGWTNLPGRDESEPCPAPPESFCTQAVIGRLADTARYIGCPGYTVLNRSDWTIHLNDEFIGCIAGCEMEACATPAILVSRREDIPDFSLDIATTSVTSRELCQFYNAGCTVVFADDDGPGYVDCACWSR